MKVTVLLGNKKIRDEFGSDNGLSYYIKTKKHKILFDMGQNEEFYNNALKLGIDLADVDIAVISLGYYDHGKGLRRFLEINEKAKIFVSKYGFEPHYSKDEMSGYYTYIGLPSELKNNKRIISVQDTLKIDDELSLYSCIDQRKYLSDLNKSLFMLRYKKSEHFCCNSEPEIDQYGEQYSEGDLKAFGDILLDSFEHEQSLVINEKDGEKVLISGYCHAGAVNIVEQIEELRNLKIDKVLGDIHLYSKAAGYSIEF